VLNDLGVLDTVGPQLQPVMDWTNKLLADARALTVTDVTPVKPKRRGWNWAP
jgi:hypothetical protein